MWRRGGVFLTGNNGVLPLGVKTKPLPFREVYVGIIGRHVVECWYRYECKQVLRIKGFDSIDGSDAQEMLHSVYGY